MNKQYKIAICISGFLRTWEYTQKSFRDILCANKNCTFDLYVHTYRQNYYEFSSNKNDVFLTVDHVKKMFKGLNVKGMVVENRDKVFPDIRKNVNLFMNKYNCSSQRHNRVNVKESSDNKSIKVKLSYRIYDQLRKINLCNEMRKNHEYCTKTKYDFIVKTRFDVVYLTQPNWDNIQSNKIYLGDGAFSGNTIDDIVAIGKSTEINHYSERLVNFKKGAFLTMCPHRSIDYTLSKHKIQPIKKFIMYKVLRGRYLVHNVYPKPHTGKIDKHTESFL